VYNFRWGLSFAAVALVISVALGIISGVNVFHIFLRTMLFVFIFFGLGMGTRALIDNFFPELLFDDDEGEAQITFDQPGSRVNITLGSVGEYAVPEKYTASGETEELGNIEDLISGAFKPHSPEKAEVSPQSAFKGIDRSGEADYNDPGANLFDDDSGGFQFQNFGQSDEAGAAGGIAGTDEEAETAPFRKPEFTPSFGDDSDGLGGLPDLDIMASAFSSGFGAESAPVQAQPQPSPFDDDVEQASYNTGNKPQPLQGDFNPKELAMGIRTVLSKDK